MKPSRCIAFFSGIFILVVGFVMTILAMSSILAYNCHFHDVFTQTPAGYMFHLMYFRSHHCDPFIDWPLLGIDNMTAGSEPLMPNEIESVTRTFWFAVIQVVFNCLLIIASINMLISTKFYWLIKTRRISFWMFFAPLSFVSFTASIIDMITGYFYSLDRFRVYSVDGTMTLLQITNRVDARPLIGQIDVDDRTLPPNVMLYISLKGVAGVIMNIVVLFFFTLAGWEVVDGSKRKSAIKFVTEQKKVDQVNTVQLQVNS